MSAPKRSEPPAAAAHDAAIGVDVGGTKCLGVLWFDGEIVAESRRATPRRLAMDAEPLVATISEIVADLEAIDIRGDSRPRPVGLGMPGLVTRSGVVRASPNLNDIIDLPIGDLVSSRVGREVTVDNDATCAAVAEWLAGVAQETTDMVLITLGTGIGAGVVANGTVLRGAHGFAGEIGHMIVDPQGIACPCGQRGCWERYASGSALVRRAEEMLAVTHGEQARWRGEDVARLAEEGHRQAQEIFTEFARWVTLGLVNVTNIFDPELIVLGGGVARTAPLFVTDVRRTFVESVYSADLRTLPRIAVAQWDERAGAVGAALLARGARV